MSPRGAGGGGTGSNGQSTWEGAQIAVPAALAGTAVVAYLGSRRANRTAARRGRRLNQRLREIEFPVRSTPLPARAEELSAEELRWLRLHDRLHGTTFGEDTIPRYRKSFDEEFVRPGRPRKRHPLPSCRHRAALLGGDGE